MAELTVVEQQVGIKVMGPLTRPVPGRLRYDPADPWAVTLMTLQPTDPVAWTFARDLLIDGLASTVECPAADPSGVGDIRVWCQWIRGHRMTLAELSVPEGTSTLALFRSSVAAFLDETLRLVPRGAEEDHVDWEALIARLLAPKKPRP